MGACTFSTIASGKNAGEAFARAVHDAEYNHGHSGYTGTIAEKANFVMIGNAPSKDIALERANRLIAAHDPRINDKWGPAGCIELGKGQYLFFGWASS